MSDGLTPRVEAWGRSGREVELAGRRIFLREQDGSGLPLLFLHGYPSSSFDWRLVLDRLPGRRATCFDFLGFGLSEKPRDLVYSLNLQADLAGAVARRFGGHPVVVVAHDMGSSVVTELLARAVEGRPEFPIAAVLLFNASLVLERASLTISQKLLRSRLGPVAARLSTRTSFRVQFARIFSSTHPLSAEEAEDQWCLLAREDGHRILDKLTFYLHERVRYAQRWHGALRDWPGRLDLGWAGRDPICTEAVLAAVRELRPAAELTRFPELGHYPQIEDPGAVAELVERVAARAEAPV